jgi:hypothetical protein
MYKFHNRRFLPYPFHHKYYMSEVGLQEESLSHLHPPNNKCKSDHAGCHPVHQPISLQARGWYGIHEVTTMCHPVRDFQILVTHLNAKNGHLYFDSFTHMAIVSRLSIFRI